MFGSGSGRLPLPIPWQIKVTFVDRRLFPGRLSFLAANSWHDYCVTGAGGGDAVLQWRWIGPTALGEVGI
jgi:hypothetical protein